MAKRTVKFKVINPGSNKLQLVKIVKEATGLGLKDAKDHVDQGTEFEVPMEAVALFEGIFRWWHDAQLQKLGLLPGQE